MTTTYYSTTAEAHAAVKAALLSIADKVAAAYAESYTSDMLTYADEPKADSHDGISHDAIGVALGALAVGLHDAIGSTKHDGAALTKGEADALVTSMFIAYVEHDFTRSYATPTEA